MVVRLEHSPEWWRENQSVEGDSTLKTAMGKALAESGGDALINIPVSNSPYGFVPIYKVFCFTLTSVDGIAIKFETPSGSI